MTTIPYSLEMAYTEQEIAATLSALLQVLAGYLIVAAIVVLALAVLMIAALWCIFKKAGTGGWKALIPVYSDYTLYKIAWKKKYFFMMLLFAILGSALNTLGSYLPEYDSILQAVGSVLTIAAIVVDIMSVVKLAKVFGKGVGFAVGIIFLPIIFIPILGFGKSKYKRRKRKKNALPQPEST